MTFTDQMLLLMRVRNSCRYFEDKPLSDEDKQVLMRSIDCGPSAGGLRAYKVYYKDKDLLSVQKAALDQKFISQSAGIFCICADSNKSKEKYGDRGELYAIQDATIAGMQITFAATALWLGTCWVGSINTEKIKRLFEVDENVYPLSLICVGYWKENHEKS